MDSLAAYKHKLVKNTKALQPTLWRWRLKDETIVFTNGCFDVLHLGHLHVLSAAKTLGTKLIVGLNSDASVKRLKGNSRPIFDQQTRQWQLAALAFVDAVILFKENTPLNLITTIKPNILVKGGDYQLSQIVGADVVIANDGVVKVIPFLEGFSTTGIISDKK